jgi:hypothetical protein
MQQLLIKEIWAVGVLLLFVAFASPAFSQQSSVASLTSSGANLRVENPLRTEVLGTPESTRILTGFVAAEAKVREALNQHTFKRDVVLQTIGPNGEVTGEYIRNSQYVFDDRGRRIERVIFHPASTIHEMRITKEDIQDLEGSQLLGIDIVEASKYQLTYAGTETVDARQLFAVDVTPRVQPDPSHMKERFFIGRVWVDPSTFQIVKLKGIVEPQGKQRFPMFVTWREPIKEALAFPSRTEADDILHFQDRDVHYRIKVRYYDYKLFGSKVSVKEVDDDALPMVEESAPKTTKLAGKEQPSSKINAAPTGKPEVCTTNRNSPPAGPYHWPADAEVKVYFSRNMFTPEQASALLAAMQTWTTADQEIRSGVRFVYAGETESRMTCRSCLTVMRREVFAHDKHHYAFFNPMKMDEGRLLVTAWIDLDVGITDPRALEGFVAHELGHGLGLWDCPSCKKKQSLMNSFPGLNQNNGLVGPSSCDVATTRSVYQEERLIAGVASDDVRRPEPARVDSALALPSIGVDKASSSVFEMQSPLNGGAAAAKSSVNTRTQLPRSERPAALTSPVIDKPGFSLFDLQSPVVHRSQFLMVPSGHR